MSSRDQSDRSHLPMPNTGKKGLITFDAKDPASKFLRSSDYGRPRALPTC